MMLLFIQYLCYDRPRWLKKWTAARDESDIHHFIQALPKSDAFRGEALARWANRDQILKMMAQHNIQWVDRAMPEYPLGFNRLEDPPLGVFYKGCLPNDASTWVGVVGSRKPSVMASYRVSSAISVMGACGIVSGGALGIDAMAHEEALKNNRPTVAVLAGGLDVLSPASNYRMFLDILDSGQGGVLSECPPGIRPKPYYFPQRNRLIAALSNKIVVVEATKKSGALLTANMALNLGIDVGAMVGAFNSPQSEGCYGLMNDGAHVIGSLNGLTEFLNLPSIEKKSSDDPAQFLDMVPVEPIHVVDLAVRMNICLDKVIEHITMLSLNGDVIMLSGQQVCRRV